jgi:hypothetical protein
MSQMKKTPDTFFQNQQGTEWAKKPSRATVQVHLKWITGSGLIFHNLATATKPKVLNLKLARHA